MRYYILLFTFLLTSIVNAQTKLTKAEANALPNTLENQFIKIYRLSNNWHEYKMIERTSFISFQKNILDSIANFKKDIITKELKIQQQQQTISLLNEKIVTTEGNLSVAMEKEDSISLFGMLFSKVAYNTLLWSVIGTLIAFLIFFIYKFKSSNTLTREARTKLEDVEMEFENHRKNVIDKEQKLRRQLQDEINKQRGV